MEKRVQEYIDELVSDEQEDVICKYSYLEYLAISFTPIEKLLWFGLKHYLEGFSIEPQAKIGAYRVDFLITATSDSDKNFIAQVVIECDGHDFHEKTKEQAIKDKTRDRELQRLGYSIIRFSGSEIWKDPSKCAEYVHHFIIELHERESKKREKLRVS